MWAPAPNFTSPADRSQLIAAMMTSFRKFRVRLPWRLAVQLVLHYGFFCNTAPNTQKYNR